MATTKNPSSKAAAYEKMHPLYRASLDADNNYDLQKAEQFLTQALAIADSVDYTHFILLYRGRLASVVIRLGEIKRSLSILAPTLQLAPSQQDADIFCATISTYLDGAMELPVSLATLYKALDQFETFLKDFGKPDWRAKLLFLQSYLCLYRGESLNALKAAQESWTLYKEGYPMYLPGGHLNLLVKCSLASADPVLAARYLGQYEVFKAKDPRHQAEKTQALNIACRHSELSRLKGNPHDAIDWARKAIVLAESIDDAEDLQMAQSIAVRAFISAGDCDRAQSFLIALLSSRHAEAGYLRYAIRLLWGDYHLAVARQAAGCAPEDDEYSDGVRSPTNAVSTIAPSPESQQILQQAATKAARAYRSADVIGRWLDHQLECRWRQIEISERMKRVESLTARTHIESVRLGRSVLSDETVIDQTVID